MLLILYGISIVLYIFIITRPRYSSRGIGFKVGLAIMFFISFLFGLIFLVFDYNVHKDKQPKQAAVVTDSPEMLNFYKGNVNLDPNSIDFAVRKLIIECVSYFGFDDNKKSRVCELALLKMRGKVNEKDFSVYETEQEAWKAIKSVLSSEDSELNREAIKICEEHIEKE